MTTSLVTGGAGFLGSHLCDRLLAEGHRVVCVDNLDTGTLENIEHIRDPAFDFVQHDMIGHLDVPGRVDYVFHLASPASPIDYLRLPLHTLKVGSYGTHNALGLAKAHRARFMLASTSEVYGDPQQHPQSEGYWGHVNPIGPRGVYDEAKRYAEALTMAYHHQQGVNTHIVRIFNTYGPRVRPRRARHPDLPAAGPGRQADHRLRRGRPDPLVLLRLGPDRGLLAPDPLRPWSTSSDGFGNPGEFTILELAEVIIRLTGSRSEIVYDALPQDDPAQRRPDISLARGLLDWSPTVDLEEGLRLTLEGTQVTAPRPPLP